MGLLSEVLRALIEKGATPEMLLAASEAAEKAQEAEQAAAQAEAARKEEERRARRREGNRIRQARYYDRHFRSNDTNGVIANERSCDNAANAPNAVTARYEREDLSAKGPQTPKNKPQDSLISSLPSEAQVLSTAKPRRHEWPEDFEAQFWAAYPRHTDRKKAMLTLRKVYRQDRTPFAALLAGCERLRASGAEIRFLPHATTWLNNERWEDEVPDAQPPSGGGPRSPPPPRATARDGWAADAIASHERLMRKRDEQRGFDFDGRSPAGAADGGGRDPAAALRERPGGQLVQFQPYGDSGRRRALG